MFYAFLALLAVLVAAAAYILVDMWRMGVDLAGIYLGEEEPWGERFYYVAGERRRGDAPKMAKAVGGRIFLFPENAQKERDRLNEEYETDAFGVFQGLACELEPLDGQHLRE